MKKPLSQVIDLKSLPNQLTLLRLLGIPLLLVIYPAGFVTTDYICALLFLLASLTDYLDGFLARTYDMETKFGAAFDHIADKLLSTIALVLLASSGALYALFAGLLIGRDVMINGARLIAAEHGRKIEVNMLGKAKTMTLSAGIFCLFINRTIYELPFRTIGYVFILIALGLSLVSAYQYLKEFWKMFQSSLDSTKAAPPRSADPKA